MIICRGRLAPSGAIFFPSTATPSRRSRASPVFLVVVQCALGSDRPHGRGRPLQNPLEYHACQCSYHGSKRVAAQRRALPPGGEIPEDYVFEAACAGAKPKHVRLSDLFAPGKDTLAIYSFMFGPERERPCPGCTHFLDGQPKLDYTSGGQRM